MDKTTKKMMTAVQKLCTEQVVKGQSKQFFLTGDLSASVRRGGGSLNCCCSYYGGRGSFPKVFLLLPSVLEIFL